MAEKPDLCAIDKDISDEDASELEDDGDTYHDDESTPRSTVTTPSPRFWHFSQMVEGNVYIGGGTISKYKKRSARSHLSTVIEKFDVKKRNWQQLETTGDHHPGLTAVACASFGKYLFAYGGNNHGMKLFEKSLNGVLSQLDLETLVWSRLSPETKDGPMRKDASGMVHFDKDKLAVVCGYAEPELTVKEILRISGNSVKLKTGGSSDTKSEFIQRKPDSRGGWTNEMHIFDIKERSWCSPDFKGQRPPPCADFTLTSIDSFSAILYCGKLRSDTVPGVDSKTSRIYVFDFENMEISMPQINGEKIPPLRFGQHVACCVGLTVKNPHLLISGGRLSIKMQPPHKDMWLLNLTSLTWQEVELPNDDVQDRLCRWGHTATTVIHSKGIEEVIIFGGSRDCYEVPWNTKKKKHYHRWADPISFIFDQKMMLRDVIVDNVSLLKANKKAMKQNVHTNSEAGDEKSLISVEESQRIELRGVDVCGETCVTVTNSRQHFKWEEFGLNIHIEENSLPADIEQITVIINTSITGDYESPQDYDRASAVFWFRCEPNIKFEKQITVEIQHCAILEHTSDLSFGRAVCTQENLPYTFKLLEGGKFNSLYGILGLSRFSGIAEFFKKFASVRRRYSASLFRITKESNHEVHIVVTWNTKAHREVVRKEYEKINAQPGPEQQIMFESDEISVNIPKEGTELNGWRIIPLKSPVIKKEDVDDYRPGRGIPSCHLLARIVDQSTVEPLEHTITLDGAQPPNTFFTIVIDPGTLRCNRLDSEPSTSVSYRLSDVDSSVTLGIDDLVDVMNEVSSRKASYYALGRALRIEHGELEAVYKQHQSTDIDMALNKVLVLWLRQNYNVERFGQPTWRMLVEAVADRAGINDHALAQEIALKHKHSNVS